MRKSIGSFVAVNRRGLLLLGVVLSLAVFGFIAWQASAQNRTGGKSVSANTEFNPAGPGTGNYVVTQIGGSIVPGTTDIGNHGDDTVTTIALPFPYTLYDQTFTSVNLSSNGPAQFTTTAGDFTNVCLPWPTHNYSVFPYWDDQRTDNLGWVGCTGYPGGTCGVYASVSGTAPNRIFNIEWRAVYFADTTLPANYEMRLYEGQNRFDVIYGTVANGNTSATAGVQKDDSTFTQYFCNGAGGAATGGQSYFLQSSSAANCNQNFDGVTAPALPPGWTTSHIGAEVNWVTSTTNPDTAPNDVFAPDVTDVGYTQLISPNFVVAAGGSTMSFQNLYNLEDGFDGMVLEISINGGPYQDIIAAGGSFVTGGYNSTISSPSNPLVGRQAWTGLSGGTTAVPTYITTTVQLPASANGQIVQMKWRVGTDNNSAAPGASGARIDTISGISCSATAANVSISGRVLTPDGRGLRNARVVITDSQGVTRTVTTSSFGFYQFDDVAAGGNYVIGVISKQYRFASRAMQVNDPMTDVDFVGLE